VILEALAQLAPHDELAARTLLQALMPGLVRLASHLDKADLELYEELAAMAWERIRTYPACRPGPVAANILRDVRKRYWQHREIEVPSHGKLPAAESPTWCRGPSAEDAALGRLEFDRLVRAGRELMGDHGFGLLLRTRVMDKTVEMIAAEDEVSVSSVKMRRFRAEQCLRPLRTTPSAGRDTT
jgi:hypothetical protein